MEGKKIGAYRILSDETLKRETKADLIERIRILEHNWSCTEESFNNSIKNSEKIFAEQKAEIDRLTEENGWLSKECNKTTAECAELTEELKSKVREFELTEKSLIKNVNENVELQKQVDELKRENNFLHVTIQNAEPYRQGVKDTAKEILQKIMNIIKKSNGFLAEEVVRIMAKQNGVEVNE